MKAAFRGGRPHVRALVAPTLAGAAGPAYNGPMQFTFAYAAESRVADDGGRVSLQPDLRRTPTYFSGELADAVAFREAAGALHDVVVSDRKYRPRDRTAFLAWKKQEAARRGAEHAARYRAYYELLWRIRQEAYPVFDPVITVHPDEIFFEAFSRDESAYARLGVSRDAFRNVRDSACGTTNIDFSADLYAQFQRLRSRRATWFEIDPAGFTVQRAGAAAHREKKIDVPDSWVRGFLQVQSATTLPAASFVLSAIDVYNLCAFLRRRREKAGPRALRWELTPGRPVEVVAEPWDARFTCAGSQWRGDGAGFGTGGSGSPAEFRGETMILRTWGRRRLHLLERLLPAAERVGVHLMGRGMPWFFVVYLGRMTFCLGLSGWTANDWTAAANFDLLTAARPEADRVTADLLHGVMRERLSARTGDLAGELGLDPAVVESGLSRLCREGRVMYDFSLAGWRLRELTAEPLPADHLAFRDDRVREAGSLLRRGLAKVAARRPVDGAGTEIAGGVEGRAVTAVLDADGRMLRGECDCHWHRTNKLRKGPCGHLLALVMTRAERIAN